MLRTAARRSSAPRLAHLRSDVAATVRVRQGTLVLYLVGVFLLRLIGVPLDDHVVATLIVWLVSAFAFDALAARVEDENNLLRTVSGYLVFELGLTFYIVHHIGTATWVGVVFPIFMLYHAYTLLPRLEAAGFTVLAIAGFCALTFGEAAGIIPHRPMFVPSADDFRDPTYIAATLVLAVLGGYGLLALTFDQFSKLQRARVDTNETRRAHSEALTAAAEALGAGIDRGVILKAITRAATLGVEGDRGSIWMIDETAQLLRRMSMFNRHGSQTPIGPDALPLTHPLVSRLLREGGVVAATSDPESPGADLARLFKVRAMLIVPFVRMGKVSGALVVASEEPRVWNAEEISTVATLALQGALAIDRAEMAETAAQAEALARLSKLKDDFFRAVGHELRTPLTVVNGYLEMLTEMPDSIPADRVPAILREIRASAADMTAQLQDLSDLARAEAGELRLQLTLIDPAPPLRALSEGLRTLDGGHRIEVDLPETLPEIEVDQIRLRQIIGNLLTNALRYARTGPIRLSAEVRERQVAIVVSDEGPGMTVEAQQRIWERYYRAEGADLVAPNGSGIGLSVVKLLVEAHGGKAMVNSTVGKGATFTILLPRPAQAPVAQRAEELKTVGSA